MHRQIQSGFLLRPARPRFQRPNDFAGRQIPDNDLAVLFPAVTSWRPSGEIDS